MKPRPCGGITPAHDPRVSHYLERSGAVGRGSVSLAKLVQELYPSQGLKFRDLSPEDQESVRLKQLHRQTWKNVRSNGMFAVFSRVCLTIVEDRRRALSEHPLCEQCDEVFNSKTFKNTLNVKMPEDENMKYVNKVYRNVTLGKLYAKTAGLQALVKNEVQLYTSIQGIRAHVLF